MSLVGKVLDLMFGKKPDIFNLQGEVEHKHPQKKWDDWSQRYTSESERNWRNHTGMKAGKANKKNS